MALTRTVDSGKDKSQLNRQASARNPLSQPGSHQRDAVANFIQQTMRTLRMPNANLLEAMTPVQRQICSTGTIMLPGKYLREYFYLLNQFCLEVYGQDLKQVSAENPEFIQVEETAADESTHPTVSVPLAVAASHHPILMPEGYMTRQRQVLAQVIPQGLDLRVRYLDTVKALRASTFRIDVGQNNRLGVVFDVHIPSTNAIATGTLYNVSQTILHLAFQVPLESPFMVAQVKRLHIDYEAQDKHFYPLSDLLHGTEEVIARFEDLESHFLDRYRHQELIWPVHCLLSTKRRSSSPSPSLGKRQKIQSQPDDTDSESDRETAPEDDEPAKCQDQAIAIDEDEPVHNSHQAIAINDEPSESSAPSIDTDDEPVESLVPAVAIDDEDEPEDDQPVQSPAPAPAAIAIDDEDDEPVQSQSPDPVIAINDEDDEPEDEPVQSPAPAVYMDVEDEDAPLVPRRFVAPMSDDEDAPLVAPPRKVTVKRRPRGSKVKPPSGVLRYGGQIVMGAAADRNADTGDIHAVFGALPTENKQDQIDFVDGGGLLHFPAASSLIHSQDFETVEREMALQMQEYRASVRRRVIVAPIDPVISQAEIADRLIRHMATLSGFCVKQKCVVAHLYHALVQEHQLDRQRYTLLGWFTGQVTLMWQDPQLAHTLGHTVARRHTVGKDEYTLQSVDLTGRCVKCSKPARFFCHHTRSGQNTQHDCVCYPEHRCDCNQVTAVCLCKSQEIQTGVGVPCSHHRLDRLIDTGKRLLRSLPMGHDITTREVSRTLEAQGIYVALDTLTVNQDAAVRRKNRISNLNQYWRSNLFSSDLQRVDLQQLQHYGLVPIDPLTKQPFESFAPAPIGFYYDSHRLIHLYKLSHF